jgi:hypothetical protein
MCGKATLLYLTAQIGYLFIVFLSLERFPQKKNYLVNLPPAEPEAY